MTRPRLRAFATSLEAEVAPFTVAGRIEQVGNAMRALEPGRDWRWIQRAASRLRSEAVPVRDKRSRLRSPEELVACGVARMARADDPASGSPKVRAACYRDGLLIALLALRPMRAKNLVFIGSGGQLRWRGGAWWVLFPASETKTKAAPLEFPFPCDLAPNLRRYLEVHRAVLLGGGRPDGRAGGRLMGVKARKSPGLRGHGPSGAEPHQGGVWPVAEPPSFSRRHGDSNRDQRAG